MIRTRGKRQKSGKSPETKNERVYKRVRKWKRKREKRNKLRDNAVTCSQWVVVVVARRLHFWIWSQVDSLRHCTGNKARCHKEERESGERNVWWKDGMNERIQHNRDTVQIFPLRPCLFYQQSKCTIDNKQPILFFYYNYFFKTTKNIAFTKKIIRRILIKAGNVGGEWERRERKRLQKADG